ncbi:MAG: molecular chaperone GrpE [Rickettsiaceae bacterium]|jgi:molecular chaperone GrpE|nr:molecular chaperone GrpE [Rickettsiaceae bacterium]
MTEEQNNNPEQTQTEERPNQNQELEAKISKLEEANKSLNDSFLRLAAELENTRKRNREELEKANKYAVSNFAGDLVLVVENFYLASENLPAEDVEKSPSVKHFADAMIMTKKEMVKVLEKYGIKRIYPLEEKFDHNYHEAISQLPAAEGEEGGVVKQVIQAGYIIGDRLIRPALVVVTS